MEGQTGGQMDGTETNIYLFGILRMPGSMPGVKIECCLLQTLLSALRVKGVINSYVYFLSCKYTQIM